MRKLFFTYPRTSVLVVLLLGVVIGQMKPVDWLYWKVAAFIIPKMKTKSLAAESPFMSVPKERWIAESQRAFVVESDEKEGKCVGPLASRRHCCCNETSKQNTL